MEGKIMNFIKNLAFVLLLVGAVNWGLVGLFNFDLVAFLFGNMSILARTIYAIVALAGITYAILLFRQDECIHYHC